MTGHKMQVRQCYNQETGKVDYLSLREDPPSTEPEHGLKHCVYTKKRECDKEERLMGLEETHSRL